LKWLQYQLTNSNQEATVTETENLSSSYDVYGYKFTISGPAGKAYSGACQDFAYFETNSGVGANLIEMIEADPDYDALPEVEASIYTPRNVVFKKGDISYIDYQGRAIGIHNKKTNHFKIQSRDPDLLYEAVYLFLLSQVGAFLDEQHMHRVHALAVSICGHAVVVLLPSGGGKSTLTLQLLKHPEVKLLSDDSPFIDVHGHVHAFPLRLGLLRGSESEVPKEHRRVIQRMEFEPKVLLNYEYFSHRVTADAKPGLLLLGARTLASEGRLDRIGFLKGFRAMTANCIVGIGLYHGLEFILESSPWEILSRFSLALSRTRNTFRFLRRSRIYKLRLGRSSESNANAVIELAKKAFCDEGQQASATEGGTTA